MLVSLLDARMDQADLLLLLPQQLPLRPIHYRTQGKEGLASDPEIKY